MHCVVYKCSNRQNSAAKENGISFYYLPQWCEEEKVLGKCCQQDRLVTTWEGTFDSIMFPCSAHLLMDDPVFSYNEKYRTDWICRWLICPLLCQHVINQSSWNIRDKDLAEKNCCGHIASYICTCRAVGHESGMIVFVTIFFIPRLTTRKFDIPWQILTSPCRGHTKFPKLSTAIVD